MWKRNFEKNAGTVGNSLLDLFAGSSNGRIWNQSCSICQVMEEGTQLFVTVDCGIRSNDDIAFAKAQGVDTILLDHHECGELPDTP